MTAGRNTGKELGMIIESDALTSGIYRTVVAFEIRHPSPCFGGFPFDSIG